VIPSYRAEKTLPSVLPRIPAAFWDDGVAIIVNDKSPDNTGEVAERLKSRWPGLEVVHHEVNQGYGGAQKTGLKRGLNLGASAFAIVHADGQYAPEVVLDLMQPIIEGKAQIVQGSRMIGGGALRGGMPYGRYIPNRILTFLENIVFGTRMAEFHSGYMIYSRRLLESAPFEQLQNNYNFDGWLALPRSRSYSFFRKYWVSKRTRSSFSLFCSFVFTPSKYWKRLLRRSHPVCITLACRTRYFTKN